jgi:prenyltransferase beta subunit
MAMNVRKISLYPVSCFFCIALILLNSSTANAQSNSITNGLNWLLEHQNADGSWSQGKHRYLDTYSSLEALLHLDPENPETGQGISWLDGQSVGTSDGLAHKIILLSSAGEDTSSELQTLLSFLHDDNGWGADLDFSSEIIDTTLALRVLKAINYPDQDLIGSTIWYLLTTQNADGGWGFYEETDSNVYMTALVSSTLQQFTRSTLIVGAINNATGYLLTKQNADGGFGSSPSTAYESALAYMAIAGEITDETVLGNAVNYIKTTQLADGSWDDDPYSTALALRALYIADINPPTPPVVPTTGSVTGTVVDSSNNQPLSGVSVVLLSDPSITTSTDSAGNFTLADVPEGSQTASFSIVGYTTAEVPIDLIPGSILDIGTVSLSPSPTTGIIKGTVTDADTELPLEGVAITVTGSYSASVLTDVNGKFTINDVTPGSVILDASLTGYYSVTGTGNVNAGSTLIFNPQLSTQPPSATTGSLTGIIVDSATSTPVTSAQILVSGITPASTDAQGAFLIENIDSGAYTVTVSASDYISQEYQVMISAGVTTDMQTIYLATVPLSTTIDGTITGAPTGTPVAGANITIPGTTLSATTDTSGTYTIQNINLLNFDIHASAAGYNGAAFHISTSGFGVYTIDFMLFPSALSTLQITSVTTDKATYVANEDVLITAVIENQGAAEVQGTASAEITDSEGDVIALVSAASPDISVPLAQTIQSEITWNTGQFSAGEYFVKVRVHDPNTITSQNPLGNLLAERVATLSITSSQSLGGSLSLTPPVTQVDMQTPVEITAAVRNTGNTVITTALHLEVALNSTVVYSTDTTLSGLHVNEVQEFDLGSFIPQEGGDYIVTLTPADASISANISKTLYVGDHASATFTVNPSNAIAGDANVTGKISLKGVSSATGSSGDPLVPLIKGAIQNGILWEQQNALSWQNNHQCYGCHVQTQTIIGAELSRGKVLVHDDKTNQFLDYIKSCQGPDGIVKHRPNDITEDQPVTSTTFFAWSLAYYHNESQILDPLTKAVDYLITKQDASGGWISDDPNEHNHWWNDFGWTQPSTPFTAYNIIALVKAYQLTGNQAYKDAVLSAVNFLLNADHTTGSVTASHIVIGLKSALPVIDDSALISSLESKTDAAITYLTNNQNADGGWGMQGIDPSDSLLSAHVLYAMSLAGISGDNPSLRNGTTYLLDSQNPDGAWSTQYVRQQTYPDRHFAATTWAIISLPSTLETIAGVSADVSVTFGSDIVLNSFSITPSSTTTSGGNTTYLWDFQGLNEKGKNLYLDLTLMDLGLGESRAVAQEASISFENEYLGTTNVIPIDIPAVTGIAPFSISVSADKAEYSSSEDVTATATVTNLSPALKNPEIHFTIEDPQGNIVQNAGDVQVSNLAPQHNPPYLNGWNNRIKLTLDHTAVDSDLTDFPVRLHLSAASGINAGDVSDIFNQLTLTSADDNFSGADGDFPDSDKWSISYFAEIANGQLRIPSSGAYRPVTGKFSLYNDFDIQVDYGFDQYPGDVSSWESIFKVRDGMDYSGKQLQISRRYTGVHDIAFNKRENNSWSTVGTYNTTEQSGRFRLTRTGSIFTSYYWNGTGWAALGSYTYSSWSGTAIVEFASNSMSGNPENVVLFDNFTVNAGTISYSGYSKKIAVTTGDGKTRCYVEVENWDDINNEANLWVKVPSVSAAADTTLYLYYDSSRPLNTEYVGNTGEYPARRVWDNGFISVYHMAQNLSDSAQQVKDSTENSHSGMASYTMNSGNLVDGQIGKALNFSLDDRDAIDLGADPDFDVTELLTIEALARPSQFRDWDSIVSKAWSADVYPWNTYSLNLSNNNTVSESVNFSIAIGGTEYGVSSARQIAASENVYAAGVYDGSNLYVYLDGQQEASAPVTGLMNVNSSIPVTVGKNYWHLYNSFNGEIDEVRISDVGRSPAWIRATSYSHNDNLITFGPVITSNYIDTASSQAFTIIWNTGTTLSGDYLVKTKVTEGGVLMAESIDDFTILPDIILNTDVTTDKIEYNANETALITSTIQNAGVNYIFENLTATVTIKDSSGLTLQSEDTAMGIVTSASYYSIKTYWNTATFAPGVYTVTLEVKDAAGAVLSTSTVDLTISSGMIPSKLLLGSISVDQQSLLQGTPVNISYSITNAGSIDLSQVDISILVVHIVNMTPYDTLTDQTSLLMGDSFTNVQTLTTQTYTAKDYLVVLRATISGVEETLASTYFRVEGAPSAPSLNWPIHGEDVETLMPELIVNNATDPNDDKLTYEFELYADSGLITLLASEIVIAEGVNTTSWIVPFELTENSMYVWRARTFDGVLHGDWMEPAAFRVNVTNEAPTSPTLAGPVNGSSADTLTPVLTVNNASDPDSTELVYNFEVAVDAGFTNIVASEAGVTAGDGTTSWQVPVALAENTTYYWRAQADDWLVEGLWMTPASFFVNTGNEAPSAPHIVAPVEGAELTVLSTDISAAGASDPDLDPLFYMFETDTALSFDSPGVMTSGEIPEGAVETIWNVAGLSDNTTYYVRVNASDSLIESPWSPVVSFFVNTVNDAPTIPILANPSDRGAVNMFNPVLSVHNSSDLDGDVLKYEFEMYSEPGMLNLVDSVSSVSETQQITSWIINATLYENQTYYWRARAFDGEVYSNWMPLSSFMVNTANDAPRAPTLNSPIDGVSIETLTPSLSINNSTDPDSDALTYDFEIYDNGVLIQSITGIPEDASGITTVTISDSLSDNTTYQWRARAYDGDRYGAWMDLATFSIHIPVNSIPADIELRPRTLNKSSNGRWVVAYIELPQGYDVHDIDRSSILLEGSIPPRPHPYRIGDHDHDGIPDLMVKFDRTDVINILPEGDEVPVTVSGTVGSTAFEGIDSIRVIPEQQWRHKPPRKRCKSNHYWKRGAD